MTTSTKTTYILLERGVEDKALLKDINKIFSDLKEETSYKQLVTRYPTLLALYQELKDEVNREF